MRSIVFFSVFIGIGLVSNARAVTVNPIVGGFGTTFPTITQTTIEISRDYPSNDPGEWFADFTLVATADVSLGAFALSPFFSSPQATLTNIRLMTVDGDNVAFGTDIFDNPFPDSVERLVTVDSLAPGTYALGVSGSGNRYQQFFDLARTRQDRTDFGVRLQVLPPTAVPIPGAGLLFLSAIASLVGMRRYKPCNLVS